MVRAILSAAAALDIYASRHLRPRKVLAALYGVSDKTVRDVWTGRTWGAVTGARNPRPLGRPRRRAFSFTTADPFFPDFQRYLHLVTKLVRAHDSRTCTISRTLLTSFDHLRENSQREVFASETPCK